MKFLISFRAFLLILSWTFVLNSEELSENSFPSSHSNEFNETNEYNPLFGALESIKHGLSNHGDADIDISQCDPVLSAECEPLTTVANCVNVISGRFFQIEKDLSSNSIEPLDIIRYYDSGNSIEGIPGFGFGIQYPIWASEIQESARHYYALISERDGYLIPYRGKLGQKTCHIDPRLTKKGYTNLSRAVISGSGNFVNWKALYRSKIGQELCFWNIHLGDGSERIYGEGSKITRDQRLRLDFPSSKVYLLTKEIKANGNQLHYTYDHIHEKTRLSQIVTLNRTGESVLDTLTFSYAKGKCKVTNSCGQSVIYDQTEEPCLSKNFDTDRKVLTKVTSPQKGVSNFHTLKDRDCRKVVKIEKPEERFLTVEYTDISHYKDQKKVERIYEPRGPKNATIATYHFSYNKHSTLVSDALKQLTSYHFDDNQRLTSIKYLSDGMKKIVREDAFQWNHHEGREGWLKSKAVKLDQNISYLKTFRYDDYGNVKQEKIYGNITGEKPETFTIEEKDSTDCYWTEYSYSDDGFNLLTKKSTPEGLTIIYAYLAGTNLCTKELHHYNDNIQERTFREYDANGQIKKITEDDGSSEIEEDLTHVTFKRVTTIEPVTVPGHPAFGKPEQEITTILNRSNGQMIPLKRIEFEYDGKGNETVKRYYNGKNVFCFETKKEFDDRHNLTNEWNALGHQTIYDYDANNNMIKKKLEGSGKTTYYSYDHVNRLIEKKDKYHKGETFITTYSYNALDQLVSETDPYGNETTYTYNRMGMQDCCIKPAVQDSNKKSLRPTIKKKYNILNQMVQKTDENGFKTHFSYNIYGSPVEITYPDEAVERFVYYPKGWLKQQWNADGTSVSYEYDPKGRVTKKRSLDKQGSCLKEEEYSYKGALLQSKKDAMGYLTTYSYDGAGRKIEECVEQLKTTRYDYDDFGRIVRIFHHWKDENGQYEIYEYDGLDRVIAKELQDVHGTTFAKETYRYDINGNKDLVSVWQSNDKISKQQFHYNFDGTLQWKEDPLRNRTTWEYHHNQINALNQRTQFRKIFDPLGRPTHETDDALHRLVSRALLLDDHQLSSTHFDYDAAGNLIKEESQVKFNGKNLHSYAVQRTYNNRGWKESETELPDGKTTQFNYDPNGRLKERIKPDGVSIKYSYDSLGRLKKKKSSDGTIDYTFEYDLHNNPILIHDHVHHTKQTRSYDALDRLIREEISRGVVLTYHYDPLSRLIKLDFPDGSYVLNTYDAFHLKKVERYRPNGSVAYVCECLSYDWEGRLLKSISPAGTIDYAYDLLGRTQRIDASHWHSSIDKFDAVGNLKEIKQSDPSGIIQGQFNYDRFDHLTFENLNEENHFAYDCIGNCLNKNGTNQSVNTLNQLMDDGSSTYDYDLNGNLKEQSNPPATYSYDALNRLTSVNREGRQTDFVYDAFNRMILIKQGGETKQLVYQGMREVGSVSHGKMNEFRLMHPDPTSELTFAIELKGTPYFPVQDFRQQVCGLQKEDGSLAQWYRYTSFGLKSIDGTDATALFNPWRFANKREVEGLSLFTHRLYHQQLRRWLTKDPLGFEDGLNLYAYVHNNPMRYTDPDGRFAIPLIITIVELSFGAIVETAPIWLPAVKATAFTFLIACTCSELATYMDNHKDDDVNREEENANSINEANWIEKRNTHGNPDPKAEGSTHTIIEGTGPGGKYTTFNEDGTFKQYRGTGKPHGNIPRPNVKENEIHETPNGPMPGKPTVRPARPDEIPKG